MTIAVTTANICGNPLRPKRAVRRRMRRALLIAGATFGQEVARSNRWKRSNYSAMWHAVAASIGKATAGGPHEVPISSPKGFEVTGSSVVLVHKGRRTISPARYITVVRGTWGGHRVALVNCHPVSKPRRGVPFWRWRINHWNLYHEKLVVIVGHAASQGYTVVFGGDMNKRNVPVVHPRQRALVESGLDHLWVVPEDGHHVANVRTRKIRRTVLMDHPILHASFDLRSD